MTEGRKQQVGTALAVGFVGLAGFGAGVAMQPEPERPEPVVLYRSVDVPGPTQYVPLVEYIPVPVEAEPTPQPTDCVVMRWRD